MSLRSLSRFNFASIVISILAGLLAYQASTRWSNFSSTIKKDWSSGFRADPMLEAVRSVSTMAAKMVKTPVYFISHGGPMTMYNTDHPVYSKLQEIGKEITTKVKPKAVVVFSAHWQAEGTNKIMINTKEKNDLIYDFYGFPSHCYKATYPNVGSKEIASHVMSALKSNGIEVESTSRGLDHGVWVCFNVLFNPETNPLNVPIVQVSLFSSEDPHQHYALGRAVSALRSENIAIIVSGMAVHNLWDFRRTMGNSTPMPYTSSFDEALKDAVAVAPAEREEKMAALLKRSDARQAHPTFDHLLPIFIGAGAAGEDTGERLWTLKEGSLSWAQYRFGEVEAS
ncbi:hypothetical protein N7G274_004489 [Stereocaulon virgatum]|uniref:Extradiol ring-cleavage dioxygenase class III enzyme subunit B domain-containing protein n=1 Tax=Stereocaulon virgatum TaxID=373712 RepID=A0ABR4AB62_9LECA